MSRGFPPTFRHLAVEEKVHPPAEQLFHLQPGRFANRLDRTPTFADHDGLLTLALNEDSLVDSDRSVLLFFPALGADCRGIRKLVMQAKIQLLARDFGGEQAGGTVA